MYTHEVNAVDAIPSWMFMNDNSQAVRIPAKFRLSTNRVQIKRWPGDVVRHLGQTAPGRRGQPAAGGHPAVQRHPAGAGLEGPRAAAVRCRWCPPAWPTMNSTGASLISPRTAAAAHRRAVCRSASMPSIAPTGACSAMAPEMFSVPCSIPGQSFEKLVFNADGSIVTLVAKPKQVDYPLGVLDKIGWILGASSGSLELLGQRGRLSTRQWPSAPWSAGTPRSLPL
jgi:hypothetical protein